MQMLMSATLCFAYECEGQCKVGIGCVRDSSDCFFVQTAVRTGNSILIYFNHICNVMHQYNPGNSVQGHVCVF
jgi:hypothetical protein